MTKTYPCQKCGKLRTAAEGGTTFTVCDACWDITSAAQKCPVCGGFKMIHGDECADCADQRRIVTERNRQRARDREIGPLWPVR